MKFDKHIMKEEIADAQHEIWSHWMKYLFSQCTENSDGSISIPKDKVERWKRQMKTDYKDLSEKEKQSDLEQADKIIKLVK